MSALVGNSASQTVAIASGAGHLSADSATQTVVITNAGSNPGVNGQTLSSVNNAAFRQHLKDNALVPNLRNSFSGAFVHPYVTAAAFYGESQFVHDSCYWCICAASSGDYSLIQAGKLALLNFAQVQHNDGFLTQAMNAGGDTSTAISNPTMIPTAALALHNAAPDTAWLAQIYTVGKKHHQWMAANRSDPVTHLVSWGTKNVNATFDLGDGTSQPVFQANLEGQDDIGYLYQEHEYTRLVPVSANVQTRCAHNFPDTSSYLAGSARDLATIAGLIGNLADQAAFTTEYAAWRTRINKWLWDANAGTYGRYALHQDSTDWVNVGATVAANVSIGATSVQIAVPSGKGLAITPGMSIICGATSTDGDALIVLRATEAASVSGTNTTITVPIVTATQAVTSGTLVRTARFSQFQTHPAQAMPLWAGVPAAGAQATAVKNELMQVLDGSVNDGVRIDFTPWLSDPASTGSSGLMPTGGRYTLEKFQSIAHRTIGPGLTEWSPEWLANSTQPRFVDSSSFDGVQLGDSTQFIAFQRRWFTGPLGNDAKLIYDTTLESVSSTYPLTVKVLHVATTVRPKIQILGLDNTTLLSPTAFGTTGSGAVVESTYTFGPATPVVLGQVQISAESGAPLQIKAVTLLEKPRGFSYLTPYGPVAQPRLARHSFAMNYSDPRMYPDGTYGNHNPAFPDYWKGQIAPYFTWHQVQGMKAYGQATEAADVTLRFCAASSNEYHAYLADNTVGACREWLGMRGAAKGAPQYGWAGLPLALMSTAQAGQGPVFRDAMTGAVFQGAGGVAVSSGSVARYPNGLTVPVI